MKKTKDLIKEHEKNYIHIPFSYRVLWTLVGLTITGFLAFWNWILMINIGNHFNVWKMLNKEAEQNVLQLIILYPMIGEAILILLFMIGMFSLFYKNKIQQIIENLIVGIILGLIYGLIVGIILGIFFGLIFGIFFGIFFGLICGLIAVIFNLLGLVYIL
jgi:hypothetical protein